MNAGNALVGAVLEVVLTILHIYIWVLVINAVLSWLVAFNIVNTHNNFVRQVGDFLYRMTEPVLRPIRRIVPPVGGFDLSPLVLVFIIMLLENFLVRLAIA